MKDIKFADILPEVIEEDELIVSWVMTKVCNFNCHYCYSREQGKEIGCLPVKEVIDCLKKTNRKCSIILAGGEVFLIHGFVDICKKMIDAGIGISIETNLSLKDRVEEFANTLEPSKVNCIYISTHILEREKQDLTNEYIQSILLLKRKGFNVRVNYVLHPVLLKRFRGDREFFKSKGIALLLRPFIGNYNGLSYPDAYSTKERALILGSNPRAGRECILPGTTGMLCSTGRSFVRIENTGEIRRCYGDNTLLGTVHDGMTLFDKPKPCPQCVCPCWGWYFLVDLKARDRIEKSFRKPALKSQLKEIKPLYFCYRIVRSWIPHSMLRKNRN
jgi:MoaA/NifB/PqqE/SkfB family radical SAM enzyme